MAETIVLNSDRRDEIGARFIFEVRGRPTNKQNLAFRDTAIGRFSKITGLREEIETVTWRDGRNPLRVRKAIGTLGGGVVTFEKGVIPSPEGLIRWFTDALGCSAAVAAHAGQTFDDLQNAIERILRTTPKGGNTRLDRAVIPPVGELVRGQLSSVYQDLVILVGACNTPISPFRQGITGPSGGVPRVGVAEVTRTILLRKCFPVAYQMADLDAMASEVAIESLSVSFDEMLVQSDP